MQAGGCAISVKRTVEYIPAKSVSSNSGWQAGWFYLRNDCGLLPAYTGKVVEERPHHWAYGPVEDEKKKLDRLLKAVLYLRKERVDAAKVAACFHRRRVLPLA